MSEEACHNISKICSNTFSKGKTLRFVLNSKASFELGGN